MNEQSMVITHTWQWAAARTVLGTPSPHKNWNCPDKEDIEWGNSEWAKRDTRCREMGLGWHYRGRSSSIVDYSFDIIIGLSIANKRGWDMILEKLVQTLLPTARINVQISNKKRKNSS